MDIAPHKAPAGASKPSADLIFSRGSVTVPKAVKEYGLSRSTLYLLMGAGRLSWSQLKPGGARILPRLAIEQLLAEGLVGTDARDSRESA